MGFSVIIPAHNEAAVIARCLTALRSGSSPGELEVVVVCNGCTDQTAELARQADPDATVLSIPEASKTAALNAGDASATLFPRIYLDADITLDLDAARATADLLRTGPVLCAAPRPSFDLGGRNRLIRWFYETWQEIPYFDDGMVGSGVYALGAEGRRRFDGFPPVTADDQFVMQLFSTAERRTVAGHTFVVHTPRSLRGLLNMRSRAYRGNAQLAAFGHLGTGAPTPGGPTILRLARAPARLPAVATYVAINLLAKLRATRPGARWSRDDSARTSA